MRLLFIVTDLPSKILSYILTRVYTFCIKYMVYHIKIGNGSKVYFRSRLTNAGSGEVLIGNNCLIGRKRKGYHAGMPFYTTILNDGINSKVIIGNNCRINGAYIHAQSTIKIGDNCVVASGVNIIDSNGHQVGSLNRSVGRDTPKPIEIGNNVWIGLNAIILKDTIIGDNCVIAAGSVVKGIIPSNTIVHPPAVEIDIISTIPS